MPAETEAPANPTSTLAGSPLAPSEEAAEASGAAPAAANTSAAILDPGELEAEIVEALKTVYDPEIPVNIYEMGLIYDLDIQGAEVKVKMTLTSPGCPVAGSLPGEVQAKVASVPGVASADVELVWEPTWNPSMMTEAARLQLGMF